MNGKSKSQQNQILKNAAEEWWVQKLFSLALLYKLLLEHWEEDTGSVDYCIAANCVEREKSA